MQLLLRNALQILDIVKATFPNELYHGCSKEIACEQAGSPGAELACLWRGVDCRLHASEAAESQTDDAVKRLFKVSQLSICSKISSLA
jgi:ethanolaminephosphotransferase